MAKLKLLQGQAVVWEAGVYQGQISRGFLFLGRRILADLVAGSLTTHTPLIKGVEVHPLN